MKRIIATDLGLTGFTSICDSEKNHFRVVDSFKIEVESKDKNIMKSGNSKPIVINQVNYKENFKLINYFKTTHNSKDIICLVEQITSRPINSAVSSMSLTDTSATFRCIFEQLDLDYKIIPPNTWKTFLNVTKEKKTSKDLFEKLVTEKKILINQEIKTLTKKVKNHNQIESVLIAYFYHLLQNQG